MKSLILLLLFTMLWSCNSVKKLQSHNFFVKTTLYNDSLNLKTDFFGDIEFTSLKKKELKRIVKNFPILKNKSLVIHGNTIIPPYYEISLFYEKDKINYLDTLKADLIYKSRGNILFKNQEGDDVVYMLLTGDNSSNEILKEDGKTLSKNITFKFPVKKELNYWDLILNSYKNENNILLLRNKIMNAPIEQNEINKWAKFQILSTFLSRIENDKIYSEIINEYERPIKTNMHKKLGSLDKNSIATTIPMDSITDKIKELTKSEKVVMLNERHWKPEHRVLASKMLYALKENGFSYLAVEAVYNDTTLNKTGHPVKSTGFYTNEPCFSLFLREAHQLGFKIVGYDDYGENREKMQAENIYKIIQNEPNAKVFVYAGEDHIFERNSAPKRMAEYFYETSQINPLTFNQVLLLDSPKENISIYRSDEISNQLGIENTVDYLIINRLNKNGSNFYLEKSVIDFRIRLPKLRKYRNHEIFVSIYLKDEFDIYKGQAVAIKNLIIKPRGKRLDLQLPDGSYHFLISDENGKNIISKTITSK